MGCRAYEVAAVALPDELHADDLGVELQGFVRVLDAEHGVVYRQADRLYHHQ